MNNRSQPSRRVILRAGAAIGTPALVALLLIALLDGVGRGVVTGPPLDARLGSYALVARTTEHPACLPLPQQCFIQRPTFQIPQPLYYAVWVGQITYPVRNGRQNLIATVRGREILRLAVVPEGVGDR